MELSGVIQPMIMCWSDGETVQSPGGEICSKSGYGIWPSISDDGWSYNDQSLESGGSWYIQVKKSDSNDYICCNSTYDRCSDMSDDSTCAVDTTLP